MIVTKDSKGCVGGGIKKGCVMSTNIQLERRNNLRTGCSGSYNFSTLGVQGQVDHLRSGVWDQPGQHGKTWSLLKMQKISWTWWQEPVIPVTWETEPGGSPEPRRQRLQWVKIMPLHYETLFEEEEEKTTKGEDSVMQWRENKTLHVAPKGSWNSDLAQCQSTCIHLIFCFFNYLGKEKGAAGWRLAVQINYSDIR